MTPSTQLQSEWKARSGSGPGTTRSLIVNADDFGLSASVNQAVAESYQHGILTSASLMVAGDAAGPAAAWAREHPGLGVGLHLVLVRGKACAPREQIPALADGSGELPRDEVLAGLRYFFQKRHRDQLELEIAAQFAAFRQTGLPLDHVNGHLNMHLHPSVLEILLRRGREWGIDRIRLTRDPFLLSGRLGRGRWLYRLSHALIFGLLSGRAASRFDRAGFRYTDRVFGLLENGVVTESYLAALMPQLPPGTSELYCHPCPRHFPHELQALTSPRVKSQLAALGIGLIRYSDLP